MFVLSFPQETCDQARVDGVSVTVLCLEGCGGVVPSLRSYSTPTSLASLSFCEYFRQG
jgi:hypothetical protein